MAQARVIGGGLAGSEAAWQLAQRGVDVDLYEMRGQRPTAVHQTDRLAELVCSNSLGSNALAGASGLLKAEMRHMGSLIMAAADASAVPAGGALAVARERFAEEVTARIEAHPRIRLLRSERPEVPEDGIPTVLATGPLTSEAMSAWLGNLAGQGSLHFYDAAAPILTAESLDMSVVFRGGRLGLGARKSKSEADLSSQEEKVGDYLNAPLNKEEYLAFHAALCAGENAVLHHAEDAVFFEACLPIEVMARRGVDTMRYGPMKPVGLTDPRTGRWPYAVVQLRQDDAAASLFNLVGFQTQLKWGEQTRIFRMIPGLQHAEFVRLGVMHRNTYLNSPSLLDATLQWRGRPQLFAAGQMIGVEGYTDSTAMGLLAGINAARSLAGKALLLFPEETMLGALSRYIATASPKHFQPMNANWGIIPALPLTIRDKKARREAMAERSLKALAAFWAQAEEGSSHRPA